MKVKVLYNHWYPKLIKMGAITLYPYILVAYTKPESDKRRILNHEWIHVNQIRKLGVVKFYVTYLAEYLYYLVKYKSHNDAYFSISYEIEAYSNQDTFQLPEEAQGE